ncbi:MAG: glutamine-hydrolyzing GMP synthase [Nitrospinota bacterium]
MASALKDQPILILDFGSQYTLLIARRVREEHVFSVVERFDISFETIKKINPIGIILSGGPGNLSDRDAARISKDILESGIPILGICYGMQLIGDIYGAKISEATRKEYGYASLKLDNSVDLFDGLADYEDVWMSHSYKVETIPSSFELIGQTDSALIAAFKSKDYPIYGLQFHPEVAHTVNGLKIVSNFVHKICGAGSNWTVGSFIDEQVELIRSKVKDSKVILALSGGVDSSVAAKLIDKAIGNKLTSIFVDNGLLRAGEADAVMRRYKEHFKLNVIKIDASDIFLSRLQGVTDPEAKRKIIGPTFVEIFSKEARKIEGATFLAQGTLYPDVIESTSSKGPSAVIKTHHNLELGSDLDLELLEPLRHLFKDEVRLLGEELGINRELLWRHPFPGPGLAVRILGEVTESRLKTLRMADEIILDQLKKEDYYDKLWQAFGVLLPVKSVGVMGDERTYENVLAIRAVESKDAMTANSADLPHSLLTLIANRIINEVSGINRVVYDITSKPPGTIEWE